MSAIKIQDNSNNWVDPCNSPVNVQDLSGNWRTIKELDRFYTGREWVYVMCTLSTSISVSTYLPATVTNGGSILISGYLNGVATSYYYDYLGGAMTYDIDKKLPITFTWDPAIASVKFNARLVTSPYTFTASNSMVLEIILR